MSLLKHGLYPPVMNRWVQIVEGDVKNYCLLQISDLLGVRSTLKGANPRLDLARGIYC